MPLLRRAYDEGYWDAGPWGEVWMGGLDAPGTAAATLAGHYTAAASLDASYAASAGLRAQYAASVTLDAPYTGTVTVEASG